MSPALLAGEVLREAVRERWVHVGPASVVLLWPVMVGTAGVTLGGGDKAAADAGLLVAWLLACVLALVLGLRALRPRADLVWVLVRPVSRSRFVLDRSLGVAAALGLQVVALLAAFCVAAVLGGIRIPAGLPVLALLWWVETCLLAFLAGLLANLLAPVPAGLAAGALWVVGHLAGEYRALAAEGTIPPALAEGLFALIPDLDVLDAQAAVVHGAAPGLAPLALATSYGVLWCVALCLLTTVVVSRKDLP